MSLDAFGQLRFEALNFAMRQAEYNGDALLPAQIVMAADTYLTFLTGAKKESIPQDDEAKEDGPAVGQIYVDVVPRLGKILEFLLKAGSEKS